MHDDVESSYESRDSSGKENVKDAGSQPGEPGEPGTEPCIPLFVREGEAAAGRMNAANLRNVSKKRRRSPAKTFRRTTRGGRIVPRTC